jgi:hypothetical protein
MSPSIKNIALLQCGVQGRFRAPRFERGLKPCTVGVAVRGPVG